jgi:hypothetical protein
VNDDPGFSDTAIKESEDKYITPSFIFDTELLAIRYFLKQLEEEGNTIHIHSEADTQTLTLRSKCHEPLTPRRQAP